MAPVHVPQAAQAPHSPKITNWSVICTQEKPLDLVKIFRSNLLVHAVRTQEPVSDVLPTHGYGPGQLRLRVRVPAPQVTEHEDQDPQLSNSPVVQYHGKASRYLRISVFRI